MLSINHSPYINNTSCYPTTTISEIHQTIEEEQNCLASLVQEHEISLDDCNQAIASYMNAFMMTVLAKDQGVATLQTKESISVKSQFTDLEQCWEDVVNYARANLPLKGKLMMKSDGFVYIKVDDEYIHTLFPMLQLQEKGFKEPPYFRSVDAPGAHISVFYKDEHIIPQEIGETFHFELKQIVIVQPSNHTSYAVLQIESAELEELRKKYGLSPKLHGHEYHISLAKN